MPKKGPTGIEATAHGMGLRQVAVCRGLAPAGRKPGLGLACKLQEEGHHWVTCIAHPGTVNRKEGSTAGGMRRRTRLPAVSPQHTPI